MSLFKRLRNSKATSASQSTTKDDLPETSLPKSETKYAHTEIDRHDAVDMADHDGTPLVAKRQKQQNPIYIGPPIQPQWH